MVTFCLGDFARRLSTLPRDKDKWAALVNQQPETCPKGCAYACREVCRDYAKVQWRCLTRKPA